MNLPHRKTNRLKNYDYSSNGIYHVTICTENHKRILSEIVTAESVGATTCRPKTGCPEDMNERTDIVLTEIGKIVDKTINDIPLHYDCVNIIKYVVMPNHIHLLLQIYNGNRESGRQVVAPTVSKIVMQLKRNVSLKTGYPIWQKGFYDHIIKDDTDFENVWTYIDENPIKWENDEYY